MRTWSIIGTLALAGAPPLYAAQDRPATISSADFAALPLMQKPDLSPDGRRIAARAKVDGKNQILIVSADNPEGPVQKIEIGKTSIAAIHWAGSERLLITVTATTKLLGTEFPMLRLIAIDTVTGASRILDPNSRGFFGGDVLYTDPSGSWALVASQDHALVYPSVKRVDLATGKAEVVEKARDKVWDWYSDENGVVRAGIAYSGRRWTLWYREAAGEKLKATKGKFAKDDDSAVDRVIFGADHNGWILTNERTGRFGVYRYNFQSGSIGEAVFEHAAVDVDDVIYEPLSGKILGIEYQDDRQRVKWLDADRDALQKKLDKALPDAVNIVVDASADDGRQLVWSGSAHDPGSYFLLDRESRKMHPVVTPYQRIDPAHLAAVTSVHYQARDGLSLPAYLTLPRGRDAKGLPLIVLPHGGPFMRDDWSYDPVVQFLANRGYAVLQPQFRGSTGYGKAFVEQGYGQFGRKMQDDLDDGVDWLARSGRIDPKRVCIVGTSYGGYAAMWGAIRNPERYRCAASMAGVSDLEAILRYDRKIFSATRYYREWRSKVAGDGDGKADLDAVSPIHFAKQTRVPLLIGHGEEDQRVPVKQSKSMVEALTKSGAEVSSVFYKESGHGFDTSADLDDWLRRLEAFLARHNPA